MSKRILIISPVPTHPQNSGNRARIFGLSSNLRALGHEVHFLFVRLEKDGRDDLMKDWWGDRFYSIPFKRVPPRRLRKLRLFLGQSPPFRKDDWYAVNLDHFLPDFLSRVQFDVVILEYLFFSRCLHYFEDSVLKIIDTLDVFANRHKLMANNDLQPGWFFTTRKEEAGALRRADVVLAISPEDQKVLSKVADTKVFTVGHVVPLFEPAGDATSTGKLLFIGSDNPPNIQAAHHFTERIFPLIRLEKPEVQLLVAGKISHRLPDWDAIIKLGVVQDLRPVYAQSDVVINPMFTGTGMSIKMIEALGHSKPVVTTSVGARGLLDGTKSAYLIADTPYDFASSVIQILSDKKLAMHLAKGAYQFAVNRNQQNTEILLEVFNH